MPALNFVAADDGLEEDPKLLTLARTLKVPRSTAFWFVMRWQRLILHKGNHVSGSLPKSYTAADVATFLDFRGDPRRLIDAMKKQGYISFKKGRGFCYPTWKDTTTGRYAFKREEERLRKERERKTNRSKVVAPSSDVRGQSPDVHEDGPRTPEGKSIERKQRSISDHPPDPPPAGGDSVADARWERLEEQAPTPQNRAACRRILETMSEDDWTRVQLAYGLLLDPSASISRKNRRVLHWPTDQFLAKQAYLRFRSPKRPSKTLRTPTTVDAAASALAEIEKRLVAGDTFVADLLRDPDVPEEKKREARERWLGEPRNRDRQPPWEGDDHRPPTPALPPNLPMS